MIKRLSKVAPACDVSLSVLLWPPGCRGDTLKGGVLGGQTLVCIAVGPPPPVAVPLTSPGEVSALPRLRWAHSGEPRLVADQLSPASHRVGFALGGRCPGWAPAPSPVRTPRGVPADRVH